jgi:hypothetical protein
VLDMLPTPLPMILINSLEEPQVLATLGFGLVLVAVLMRRLVTFGSSEFVQEAESQAPSHEVGGD